MARIKELEIQLKQHVAEGRSFYEVVVCIEGRGFRERNEDMRQMLLRLNAKVFTMATIDPLITYTRIREFVSPDAQSLQNDTFKKLQSMNFWSKRLIKLSGECSLLPPLTDCP